MSADRYRISLIVPIYGVEKYIERFAESALGQTYQDLQFVFVNDGTKDRSMDILRNMIDRDYSHLKDRIVLIDKQNEGLPAAWSMRKGNMYFLLILMTGWRRMRWKRS